MIRHTNSLNNQLIIVNLNFYETILQIINFDIFEFEFILNYLIYNIFYQSNKIIIDNIYKIIKINPLPKYFHYFHSIIIIIDMFTITNNNFNSAPLELDFNVIKPQLNS